nr:L-type lectin-domain containing receptor kinase IV.1-like [Ipomoea batatas]
MEVATGKRPIQPKKEADDFVLVDWVFSCWAKGNILEAMDRNMGMEYAKGEAELVLKLGLLCSHPDSGRRPTIRQVVQYLEGDGELPELSAMGISSSHDLMYSRAEGFDSFVLSHKSSMMNSGFSGSTSITESFLSGGRRKTLATCSITAFPPVCMHMCSNAVVKSGTARFDSPPGPVIRAVVSPERVDEFHLRDSSSGRVVSDDGIDRFAPVYQFREMLSVATTRAFWTFLLLRKILAAKSTEITPELHPIPLRSYVFTSGLRP